MRKNVFFIIISLAILSALAYTTSTYARKLTQQERKFYAQNNIIFTIPCGDNEESCDSSSPGGRISGDGCFTEFGDTPEDNAKTALVYLMSVGYSPASAAAIVGVMSMETGGGHGIRPDLIEGGKTITDTSWRADTWNCKTENDGKCGFGIMQWTDKEEKANLQALADHLSLPVISLELQLIFLVRDLACSKEADCDRTDPNAMHKKNDAYAYFDVDSLNKYSASSVDEAVFWITRRYTIPWFICNDVDGDGVCYRSGKTLVHVPAKYPEGANAARSNGGGNYLSSGNKYLSVAQELSSQVDTLCSGGGGNPGTPASTDAQLIVDTALKMSWPNDDGQCRTSSGFINWTVDSPAQCKTTLTDYAKSITRLSDGSSLQDCGKFVSYVLRNTVDAAFPELGVSKMIPHLESSSKWKKVSTDDTTYSLSNLQSGDILAFSKEGGSAKEGHIMIYIGNTGGSPRSVKCGSSYCNVYMAEASYLSSTPRLTKRSSLVSPSTGINYSVFRYVGGS